MVFDPAKLTLRLANNNDLPQITSFYQDVVDNLNRNEIPIWNDIYPACTYQDDSNNQVLYLLLKDNEILAVFAVDKLNTEEGSVQWLEPKAKALYLYRISVNVNYLNQGIGKLALEQAEKVAKEKGAEYLRLLVGDINVPAIKFYLKWGMRQAPGYFDEKIEDDSILHEYGFEIKV